MVNNLYNVVSLQSFTVFPEYFITLSIIYILIVITLITYNSNGLMLQKAISECMALILFMTCYLILNDDFTSASYFIDILSFSNAVIYDSLASFTRFWLCFFSGVYFLFVADSLKEQKLTSFEYLIIILFAILGLLIMCSSNDLLLTYLAIELSSLALYVLASFKKTSSYSVESGIKYFITGAVSSAFFLLGSSFIYGFTGSINFFDFYRMYNASIYDYIILQWFPGIGYLPGFFFESWLFSFGFRSGYARLIEVYDLTLDDLLSGYTIEYFNFVEIGLTLILFSLFIKLAAAPFHLWSLDVYEGSPTSSTIFFAVITKLSILVVLIRLCHMAFFEIKEWWDFYFLSIGVLSIFVGSFGGLKQRKLKTLLAYSSTSHMGYILIAMGSDTFTGVQMALVYMIIYMISSLCVWSILLFLRLKRKNITAKYNKELGDLALLRKSNISLSLALSLTMFSIAGIPPLVGFLAKLGVFLPLIINSYYLPALASIVFSVVSTFYYIRLIKVLYFENILVGKLYYPINSEKTIILSILIFALIFLFCNPTLLYLACYKISLALFVDPVTYSSLPIDYPFKK